MIELKKGKREEIPGIKFAGGVNDEYNLIGGRLNELEPTIF